MSQGSRPDRVAEEIRHEMSTLLMREVHDPGIGFITITRVKVSPDLQVARIYYSSMADDKGRAATKAALERAKPFLRRQIGQRIQLRRVPEIMFHFDEGIAHQARVEELLIEIKTKEAQDAQVAQEITPTPPADVPAPADVAGDLQVPGTTEPKE
jgi:ribosome-binding factor A